MSRLELELLATALLLFPGSGSSAGDRPDRLNVAVVITKELPQRQAIVAGLGAGLAGTGHTLTQPELPLGRAGGSGWRGATDLLARLTQREGVTVLVVGPERSLVHLALQFGVKAGVHVILVACSDPGGRALPLLRAHHLPVEGSSDGAFWQAGNRAARWVEAIASGRPVPSGAAGPKRPAASASFGH
jgi:hypothetical protein